MSAKEPKRSWKDIVDEPMRGKIPTDLFLTPIEARQVLRQLSSSLVQRLRTNSFSSTTITCIREIAGLDYQGNPADQGADILARMQQRYASVPEDARTRLEKIIADQAKARQLSTDFIKDLSNTLKLRHDEINAMPKSDARTEALRDFTTLHNAITDVVCKPKGKTEQVWGRE